MTAAKIQLPTNKETYLATLYGKALDATLPDAILGDRFAADAVARLDYDFAALRLPRGAAVTLPLRAYLFDTWTRAFLAANPQSTVLHLGCGLDSRVYRIDPPPSVRWFDVDRPDVIALRAQLYGERPGYQRIGTSVTNSAWLDAVDGDLPVLVVAEGLMMYLPEEDGTALLRRISAQFPRGEVAFDGYSRAMVRLVSRLAALRDAKVELVWGINDPHDLERQVPGLRLLESLPFLTVPALVRRLARTPLSRATSAVLGRLPFYRNLVRHLRYGFVRAPMAATVP